MWKKERGGAGELPSPQRFLRAPGETGGCLVQSLAVGSRGCRPQPGDGEQLTIALFLAVRGGCHAQKQVTEAPSWTPGQGPDCLPECSSHPLQ